MSVTEILQTYRRLVKPTMLEYATLSKLAKEVYSEGGVVQLTHDSVSGVKLEIIAPKRRRVTKATSGE